MSYYPYIIKMKKNKKELLETMQKLIKEEKWDEVKDCADDLKEIQQELDGLLEKYHAEEGGEKNV